MKEDAVGICVLAAMTLTAYFIIMACIGCASRQTYTGNEDNPSYPCYSEDYNDCGGSNVQQGHRV